MRYSLILLGLVLLSGCSSRRAKPTTSDAISLTAVEQVLQKLERNHFDAEWVDARAGMKVESPEMNVSGTAYIRLQKDEKLWVSVKKFGFEAARALITPDSLFIINRLSNEYSADPLSYLTERFGIPARFDLIQEIVLGNPIFFDRNLSLSDQPEAYKLSGKTNRWVSDYYINKENHLLNSMRIKQLKDNQQVSVFVDGYTQTDTGQSFAVNRSVEIESPSLGLVKVEMDITKYTFDKEVNMPFEVPRRFRQ